jgi:hypothetical protein
VTALFVIPRHDVPRNPSTSFGVPYRRDPLKRDVAPTMNDPVNVIMTQSVSLGVTVFLTCYAERKRGIS